MSSYPPRISIPRHGVASGQDVLTIASPISSSSPRISIPALGGHRASYRVQTRRTKEVGSLLPQLYLHGLALGDFELAHLGRETPTGVTGEQYVVLPAGTLGPSSIHRGQAALGEAVERVTELYDQVGRRLTAAWERLAEATGVLLPSGRVVKTILARGHNPYPAELSPRGGRDRPVRSAIPSHLERPPVQRFTLRTLQGPRLGTAPNPSGMTPQPKKGRASCRASHRRTSA